MSTPDRLNSSDLPALSAALGPDGDSCTDAKLDELSREHNIPVETLRQLFTKPPTVSHEDNQE